MAKTLSEYAEWLDERKLVWPAAPKRVPITAKPSIGPLAGIRAVAFSVYGTLLRITDGQLLLQHPQAVRMEIALDKTIKEFNMWNSMTRKPGKPWEGDGPRGTRGPSMNSEWPSRPRRARCRRSMRPCCG